MQRLWMNFLKEKHILVDVDKFTIEDSILDQTSIKVWTIARCISFAALKGLSTLDINIDALSIQLYNTSSF
jgi:hypothetical protein